MKILCAILLLLLALLLWPIVLRFSVSGKSAEASVRYLFLRLQMLPRPQKGKRPAKKPPREKKSAKEKGEGGRLAALRNLTPSDWLTLIPDLIRRCIPPVRALLRRTALAKFSLRLVVAGEDAAATAIGCGRWQGVICNTVALLDRLVRLRAERIEITPDFCGGEGSFDASGEVRLCPLAALIAACNLAVIALCAYRRASKQSGKQAQACE